MIEVLAALIIVALAWVGMILFTVITIKTLEWIFGYD